MNHKLLKKISYPSSKPKHRERRSRPLKRAVHVNGQEWRWEYAEKRESDGYFYGYVKILSPSNKYRKVSIYEPPMDGLALPSTVKGYIEKNLIGV